MTRNHDDDTALIRAAQGGNESAFEALVRRYQNQVASIIAATIGTRSGVDDLAQEVFIKVFRSLSRFEFTASFQAWLYRITVNVCLDELRKRKIRRYLALDTSEGPSSERIVESGRSTDDDMLETEKRNVVLGALKKIPAPYRTAIVLREYEDLSYDEIARIMGISTQAVKTRIFRAREKLRSLLHNYFPERS